MTASTAPLPSLSVLIPCYNARPFVVDCVESVVTQMTADVECIVVDDGSTDGSAEEIDRRYGDSIRVHRQANAGAGAARNRCLELASGELVVWLDADDYLAPGSLERRRRVFADDPSLEMLVAQYECFDMDTGTKEVFPKPPCDEHYLVDALLARTNLPHLDSLTFRRTAVQRIGRFDDRLIGEDWDFWLRCWARLRWRFVPDILAYQRQGSHDSVTHRLGKLSFYREQSRMLRRSRPLLRELLGSDRPWRHAYARYAADHALVLLTRGYRRTALWWALRSLVGSTRPTKVRGLKYAAEAVAPRLYRRASAMYKRVAGSAPLNWRDGVVR